MSNCAYPIKTVTKMDSLLDFVNPVYLLRGKSSLKSFNAVQCQTFSDASVNMTLNLNSTQFVVDPNITWTQPVDIEVVGTTSTGANILIDNCFSVRSNALAKITETIETKYLSTSVSQLIGDIVNSLERYGSYDADKYSNDFNQVYLDKAQEYDSLVGSARNPMNYYGAGEDGVMHRGTQPLAPYTGQANIINTPTLAKFQTTLRSNIFCSPLVDKMKREGLAQGLSHLDSIQFNINFYAGQMIGNRLLSFAQNRPAGDVLTITSIRVKILQPTFSFVQLKSRDAPIPSVISKALKTVERYPFSVTLPPLGSGSRQFSFNPFNLSRCPDSLYLICRPSNNAYASNLGAFIPDACAQISNLVVSYDGQVMFSGSSEESIYKMCYENGYNGNFLEWSGKSLIKSVGVGANPVVSTLNGSGSVLKLKFSKDISLYAGKTVGMANNCAITVQCNLTNLSPLTNDYEFSVVCMYDDVIQFADLTVIQYTPVSQSDVDNMHQNEMVHNEVLQSQSLTGGGILDSAHSLISSGKLTGVIRELKSVFADPAFRNGVKDYLRMKGHNKAVQVLEMVGFGKRKPMKKGRGHTGGADYEGGEDCDYEGGEDCDYEGGRLAPRHRMKSSLLR